MGETGCGGEARLRRGSQAAEGKPGCGARPGAPSGRGAGAALPQRLAETRDHFSWGLGWRGEEGGNAVVPGPAPDTAAFVSCRLLDSVPAEGPRPPLELGAADLGATPSASPGTSPSHPLWPWSRVPTDALALSRGRGLAWPQPRSIDQVCFPLEVGVGAAGPGQLSHPS